MEHSLIVFALFLNDNRAYYTAFIVLVYLVLAISYIMVELDCMIDNAEVMVLDENGEPVLEKDSDDPVTLKFLGYDGKQYLVTNKGGDANESWLIAPERARLVL